MTNYRQRRPGNDRIAPAAYAAFQAGDWMGLQRELRLKPWEASPLDATTDTPPAAGRGYRDSWPRARALRAELEKPVFLS